MKTLLTAIVILGVVLGIAADDQTTIPAAKLSVAGISLGASEEQIRTAFGEPVKITRVKPEAPASPPELEFEFEGARVYFVNDEAYNVRCTSSEYATRDGVRVGEPTSRIVAVYGQSEIIKRDGENLYRYRVDGTDTYLLFFVRRGRITAIELWFDWT